MSTCDKRYKTAGPGQYANARQMNPTALTAGMQRASYASRGNFNYGPQGMAPGVGRAANSIGSRFVTGANGDGIEVAEATVAGCNPVALAPAPLQECATECTKKVACFCGGSYFLSEKGKIY